MRSTHLHLAAIAALPALLPAPLPAQSENGLQGRTPSLHVVEPDEHERDLRMTPVVRAVKKAADSVVSIYINLPYAYGNREPVNEGQGSGVILDESGFVITNWHVIAPVQIDDDRKLEVKLRDGRARPARLLSSSPEHDLALLQVQLQPGETVQPIEIGRSADLMIGEDVIAIGNPQGHANTVTKGVLSAIDRSIHVRAPGGVRTYGGLLQTDAAINQGNSGGALLDITGKLIGINNAMAMGAENIGFAIPVDTMREVFENQLVASESFALAGDSVWLGFQLAEGNGGLVVNHVVPGGPAARAGVQAGDVLVGVAGAPVQSYLDYTRRALLAPPGRPLAIELRRGEREVEVQPRPLSRVSGRILELTGMAVDQVGLQQDRDFVEQVTRAFWRGSGLRRLQLFPAVLRVRDVQAGSPAAALGVQPDDVLMGYRGRDAWGHGRDTPVFSAGDLADVLWRVQGRSLGVLLFRDGEDLMGTLDVRDLRGQR